MRVAAWDPERFLASYAAQFVEELVNHCARGYPGSEHVRRAKMPGQLHRRNTQAADAEDRDRFARTQSGFVQRMQRGGGRAHQNRALLEWNFVR